MYIYLHICIIPGGAKDTASKKNEHLPYSLNQEAIYFIRNRDMFKPYIHMDAVENNLY